MFRLIYILNYIRLVYSIIHNLFAETIVMLKADK